MSCVDGEPRETGNDIHLRWLDCDRADRRDGRMPHAHRGVRDRERHRRRSEKCIAAAIHGHRAGVVGLAAHGDLEMCGAGDGRDDAESRSVVLKDGALLDMELDKSVEVPAHSGRGGRWIESDRAHRVAERHAVGVTSPIGLTGLEPIGDRARTPEVRVEATPLLLADRDALEYSCRSAEPLPQAAHRLDPRDYAERSIQRAAAAHGVDVRTRRDHAATARSLDAAPHVADSVALHEKAGLLHPRRDKVHRRGPGGRVQRPIDAA